MAIYRLAEKPYISKSNGFKSNKLSFLQIPLEIAMPITSTAVHWASQQLLTLAPQEALWHMLQGAQDTRSSQGGIHLCEG